MATSDPKRPWETSPWRTFKEEPPADPPSVGKVLGVIAIAVGAVALGAFVFDMHSHRCESCGNHWRHLGAFNVGDPDAHTCSTCGTVQWWKDGVPHVFRAVLRDPPPMVMSDTLVSRLREIGAAPRNALSTATGMSWPRKDLR